MANSVDPDQTAPIGSVYSGSTLFASILNSSLMLGNYLQQTTSADDIFRCIFFLGALRVNITLKLHFWHEKVKILSLSRQRCYLCHYIKLVNMSQDEIFNNRYVLPVKPQISMRIHAV